MRLGLSVGRGAQEPQRESVNLFGLVNYCRAEADTSWMVAGSNVHSLCENAQVPSGLEGVASVQWCYLCTWEV